MDTRATAPTLRVGQKSVAEIEQHARQVRCNIIRMLTKAGSGHPASSLGLADIMTCLYFNILKYNPRQPDDLNRDLLVLSNGHVCPVLYAVLAEAGLIPQTELMTLRQFGSRLQGHPERTSLPWLETTSGPLGEGMAQAAGMAYYLKYLSVPNHRRVYCLVGDGECDEGNIWETIMFAAKYKLANMIVVVDWNNIQLSGPVADIMPLTRLVDSFQAANWQTSELVNGNSVADILTTLSVSDTDQPRVIIAHTTPGRGVSFMENDYHWHGQTITTEQAKRALSELGA